MNIHHSANLRRGRHSEIGRVYLLTAVIDKRQQVFADFTLARVAMRCLRDCDFAGESATLACVLMPDHLHWLFSLQCADISHLARRFKSNSARQINAIRGTPGIGLWQRGFHDHALRKDEDIQQVANYMLANPVRAGLVESVNEYSHWYAVWD